MDLLSCTFILLIIVILGLFIRFLVRLYKDRGRLAFQPGESLEEAEAGEFEMPEYFQYGQSLETERPTPDSQDSFDYHDAYKEYGIYQRHQRMSLVENPMMRDPRSMIDPRYYKVDCVKSTEILPQPQQTSDAAKRRIQFQLRHQSLREPNDPGKVTPVGRERREQREVQASRTYERRGSYNACLNCEMISMGSATLFGDNTCGQCGKQWAYED